MSRSDQPRRTTAVVGTVLALLLATGAWVAATIEPREPGGGAPVSTAPSLVPLAPSPTPSLAQDVPRPGRAFAVRRVGALRDRSVVLTGRGSADLRYARAAENGTRVHFICTGCDADTWLVEWPPGAPVGGGPLRDPSDVTGALDTANPGASTSLLVKTPTNAEWVVTLTPFDEIPVHRVGFDALDDDVVAVRATGALTLTCGGAYAYRTYARDSGRGEYAAVARGSGDRGGTATLTPGRGTDLLVLAVSCPGRWTVVVP